ncbi:MAG: DUF502 domain-containing protein [Desulfitobacterium hafniense]|nr:DUF502 domain-containing protein [Desulfitobacterium hafniense]
MKKVIGVFLRGAITIAPIAITLYILYNIYVMLDGVFKGLLESAGLYFPGLGAVLTLALVFLVGLLTSNWITNRFLRFIENIFVRVPLVKSIYSIIKDTINSFSGEKKGFSRLAIVELPNSPIKLLGFITNEGANRFIPEGYCSVYLMQSMQWAGNLILVPRECVREVDATSEEAIKFIASAGLI